MCIEHDDEIYRLKVEIDRLVHALKNEQCASKLMKHLADQYQAKTKLLTKELSLLRVREPA